MFSHVTNGTIDMDRRVAPHDAAFATRRVGPLRPFHERGGNQEPAIHLRPPEDRSG